MKRRVFRLRGLGIIAAFLVFFQVLPCLAQTQQSGKGSLGPNLSLTAIGQFETDLGESSFSVSRYVLDVEKYMVRNRKLILALSTSLGISEYSFSGQSADPWSDPWERIWKADIGLSAVFPGSGRWSYFLAGALDWSWEEDAGINDALVFGVIASAVRNYRQDRRLGLGAGVFEGLEEFKIFPYVSVNWRFNEKLSLLNPLRAGPTGPAGLEIVYTVSEIWELGGGAAYRSIRFRLDDAGIAPDGIGEITGVPVWFRATRLSGSVFRLDLYLGAVLAGEALIEDRDGGKLESQHHETAPLAALVMEIKL